MAAEKSGRGILAGSRGFTMVELLMAIALGSIVMAAVYSVFIQSNRSFVVQEQVVGVQQNVRSAMEVMVHEIRMAGYIPEDDKDSITTDVAGGTPPAWADGSNERIEEATAAALTFEADLNADDATETVRYALSGTNLTRESWEWDDSGPSWVAQGAGPVVVAENVTSLVFGYTFADGSTGIPDNTDGNDDNDREDVRAVSINMTGRTRSEDPKYVNPDDGTGYRTRTLVTFVEMRNMGLD